MSERTYVALLRGINVGGKNSVPMKDLVAMFEKAGCAEVSTYIQSGNVVFRAEAALAVKLPAAIGAAIKKRFGFEPPVVLRSGEELRKVAEGNPFIKCEAETLHVAFLADLPGKEPVRSLEPKPPDEFAVIGREIYLRCPNGYGKTKLTNAWFDSRLKTISTVRNWRTVLKLLEMTKA